MCSRFTQIYTWRELRELYGLLPGSLNLQARYSICPRARIDVVLDGELVPMRWGLIPRWWSGELKEMKLATFNACVENVDTKQVFRTAFRRNRCIIPASGYYEWEATPAGKRPWYFTGRNGAILSVAGLWEEWTDRDTGTALKSCTMVVTDANRFAADVYDRMPVLLQPDQFEAWLSGKAGKEMLVPAPETMLRKWPVSSRINSSLANDEDATLIAKS
jgi:putative SOS response-associated peptidase YedK